MSASDQSPGESTTRRRVLMVAFHFPPFRGGSGLHRTDAFARYLPEFGWDPIVLTVRPSAYERVGEVSPRSGAVVERTPCFDAARHMAIRGRYLDVLALPDRWSSWAVFGFVHGLSIARRDAPHVLWSTYPIATSHLLGYWLACGTGLPWIADFRDPMCQDGYPAEPRRWKTFDWIERRAIERSACTVFTAPTARTLYQDRYPSREPSSFRLISNGYDEADFRSLLPAPDRNAESSGPLRLLHSGTVYPSERDPTSLFTAIAELRDEGTLPVGSLELILRATGHDDVLSGLIDRFGLHDHVRLEPGVPYHDALAEAMGVDALLVLQASNCNYQIPAKVYEYLRTGRPILALCDPVGDTAGVLAGHGVRVVTGLDDTAAIKREIAALVAALSGKAERYRPNRSVGHLSRRSQARQLAALLDEVAPARSAAAV